MSTFNVIQAHRPAHRLRALLAGSDHPQNHDIISEDYGTAQSRAYEGAPFSAGFLLIYLNKLVN